MPDHGADDRGRGPRGAMSRAIPSSASPDLDDWLPDIALHLLERRTSRAEPDRLWDAAAAVGLRETGLLGRLIRWRIPGTPAAITFGEMFRRAPFLVLEEHEHGLVSGLVGRIWTVRRDYPELSGPDAFRNWDQRGTARVVFAHWVEPCEDGGAVLVSDVRVEAIGPRGALGVAAVRPLVRSFGTLVGSEGLQAAVRRAERP
jgi:hypothetical protein